MSCGVLSIWHSGGGRCSQVVCSPIWMCCRRLDGWFGSLSVPSQSGDVECDSFASTHHITSGGDHVMQRLEFDSHPVWVTASAILERVEGIEPADADETTELERIAFLVTYLLEHKDMAAQYGAFFTKPMLDAPVANLNQANSYLSSRESTPANRAQTKQAIPQVEAILTHMAPWPRRYGRGAQVSQMTTLFEDLLARQGTHLREQEERQIEVIGHLEALDTAGEERHQAVLKSLETVEASGQKVSDQIDAASGRIDEVVQTGLKTIDGLKEKNNESYSKWLEGIDGAWRDDYKRYFESVQAHQKDADEALASLKKTVQEHQNLTTLSAADTLAKHFASQSTSSHKASVLLFVLGFLFLVAAAAPFVPLLFDQGDTASWPSIVLRLSFGVLAGSAATVAFRLGGRFSNEATSSQRMEMELPTFGPFLATVTGQDNVDAARLELVDRAFGKSYIAHLGQSQDEDSVPVAGLTDIINAIARVANK